MYQRAPIRENGSFVQAGYPDGTAESAALSDTEGNIHTNPPQEAENASENTPQGEHLSQKTSRNGIFDSGELLSRLRLSSLDAGDLLLAAILYFTLHDTGDDDLFWIAAILFLTGKGSEER